MKATGLVLNYILQYVAWSLFISIMIYTLTDDRVAELVAMFMLGLFIVVAIANMLYYDSQIKKYKKPYH